LEKINQHPITESFEIKKNQEKEITREFSKFTLNNKKSEIELRYPDGEVASSLKYNKKNSEITEGEIYQKIKDKKMEMAIAKKYGPNKKPDSSIGNIPRTTEEIETTDDIIPSPVEKENQPEETSNNLIGKFSQRKT